MFPHQSWLMRQNTNLSTVKGGNPNIASGLKNPRLYFSNVEDSHCLIRDFERNGHALYPPIGKLETNVFLKGLALLPELGYYQAMYIIDISMPGSQPTPDGSLEFSIDNLSRRAKWTLYYLTMIYVPFVEEIIRARIYKGARKIRRAQSKAQAVARLRLEQPVLDRSPESSNIGYSDESQMTPLITDLPQPSVSSPVASIRESSEPQEHEIIDLSRETVSPEPSSDRDQIGETSSDEQGSDYDDIPLRNIKSRGSKRKFPYIEEVGDDHDEPSNENDEPPDDNNEPSDDDEEDELSVPDDSDDDEDDDESYQPRKRVRRGTANIASTVQVPPRGAPASRPRSIPSSASRAPPRTRTLSSSASRALPQARPISFSASKVPARPQSSATKSNRLTDTKPPSVKTSSWLPHENEALFKALLAQRQREHETGERRLQDISLYTAVEKVLRAQGIHRSHGACKNQWNRFGRAQYNFDERLTFRNPSLVTSRQ